MLTDNAINTIVGQAEAARKAVSTPDGGVVLPMPNDWKVHAIPPIEPALVRIRQHVTMHDRESFVSYVNRFKGQPTRLFAEPGFLAGGTAHVTAVIDYHGESAVPGRCVHGGKYLLRYSDQWRRWVASCAGPMTQAEFAEFIEENRADIAEPAAVTLLDIVRTFKASKKTDFDSVVYQPNGNVKLAYSEATEQKGTSGALPEQMKLGIPVYFRGTVYAVPVFVRYRVGNGGVRFQMKMDRADVIEDAAFGEVCKTISDGTGIEVYLGRNA